MQKRNIKLSKCSYLISKIFLLVSIIFIIIAFTIGRSAMQTKLSSDAYTIASRVEMNSYWSTDSEGKKILMYSPVFYYKAEGREYKCSTTVSSNYRPKLKNNKIFYNSKNPESCISEYSFVQSVLFAFIFFIIALPFFIIGLLMLIKEIKAKSKYKRLEESGQLIKDIPCRIIPSNETMNNKRGYIVEIEYEGLKLKSEAKFDIDIRRNTADLLIDPLDAKNYFIGFDMI